MIYGPYTTMLRTNPGPGDSIQWTGISVPTTAVPDVAVQTDPGPGIRGRELSISGSQIGSNLAR